MSIPSTLMPKPVKPVVHNEHERHSSSAYRFLFRLRSEPPQDPLNLNKSPSGPPHGPLDLGPTQVIVASGNTEQNACDIAPANVASTMTVGERCYGLWCGC
eukprot:7732744-Pyramimonas_sp.AAC.1